MVHEAGNTSTQYVSACCSGSKVFYGLKKTTICYHCDLFGIKKTYQLVLFGRTIFAGGTGSCIITRHVGNGRLVFVILPCRASVRGSAGASGSILYGSATLTTSTSSSASKLSSSPYVGFD